MPHRLLPLPRKAATISKALFAGGVADVVAKVAPLLLAPIDHFAMPRWGRWGRMTTTKDTKDTKKEKDAEALELGLPYFVHFVSFVVASFCCSRRVFTQA